MYTSATQESSAVAHKRKFANIPPDTLRDPAITSANGETLQAKLFVSRSFSELARVASQLATIYVTQEKFVISVAGFEAASRSSAPGRPADKGWTRKS